MKSNGTNNIWEIPIKVDRANALAELCVTDTEEVTVRQAQQAETAYGDFAALEREEVFELEELVTKPPVQSGTNGSYYSEQRKQIERYIKELRQLIPLYEDGSEQAHEQLSQLISNIKITFRNEIPQLEQITDGYNTYIGRSATTTIELLSCYLARYLDEGAVERGAKADAVSSSPICCCLFKPDSDFSVLLPLGTSLVGCTPRKCFLCLKLPTVSSVHASITVGADGSVSIKDMNSTNGTYVNGIQLSPMTEYHVDDGDVIDFAGEKFQVQILESQNHKKLE